MPVTKLTAAVVQNTTCPNNKSKLTLSDTQIKGLVLEVRKSGGKTYYVRYRDLHGSQRHYKVANADSIELSTARKKAQEVLAQIALGEDPLAEKKGLRKVLTVQEFTDQHYLPYAKSYKRAWSADLSYLKNHILPALGKKRLSTVTRTDIANLHLGMKEKGYADGTSNRVLVLLRFMFNLAIKWEMEGVKSNPTKEVNLFQLNNKRNFFLTKEQVNALITEVKKSQNKQLYYIVCFLLLTGARRGEALSAEWKDIDLHHRVWTIPLSKSGKARMVPLSDMAMALLEELPSHGKSDFLFPNPKTDQPYVAIFNAWDYARNKAGLPNVRIHDLRHSFASFLVNSGRSLYEVQKLLGHAHISTTERYAHLSAETLISAANSAGDFMPVNSNKPVALITGDHG